MTNTTSTGLVERSTSFCKYSMGSFRVKIPEFESQRFFFLFSISFFSSKKLEFLMFYVKAFFFYFARAQFICKRIYFIRHKANTIPMQCRCKTYITFANRRMKMGLQYHLTRQRKGLQPRQEYHGAADEARPD